MATDLEDKKTGVYDTDADVAIQQARLREISELKAAEEGDDPVNQELMDMANSEDYKTLSAAKLKENEAQAGANKAAYDGSDDFKTNIGEGKPNRFSLRGKARKSTIGAIIATMVVGGGIFGGTIATGPMQFIQASKLMQRLHLSDGEDNGESRIMNIAKRMRNKNMPQNNRMGTIGNKLADEWEARMRSSGIDPQYSRTGNFDKFVIDTDKLSRNPEFDGLNDYSPETVQKHFKENLDVDLTLSEVDGVKTLSFDAGDIKARPLKKVTRIMMRSSGYSRIGSAMRARSILPRQGAPSILHPFKTIDRKIINSTDSYLQRRKANKEAYQKQKVDEIEKGKVSKELGELRNTTDKDGNGVPDSPSEDASTTRSSVDEVDKLITEAGEETAEGAAKGTGKWAGATSSPALKKAGAATLLVGVICMAQSLSAQYDTIAYNNVAQPLIRLGADTIASGDQIMGATALGQPLDIEQLGFASDRFTLNGASWMAAASIQTELGEKVTGPDMPKEASLNKDASPVSDFFNTMQSSGVPVNELCGALNSTGGQIVSFGVDFIGGPIGAIAGFAASQAVAPLLTDGLLGMISGTPLDVMSAAGPKFGNLMNFGSFLFANDSALGSGGAVLSKAQAYEVKVRQREEMNLDFKEKSFAGRTFDPTEPLSLAGRIINSQSPKVEDNLQNMASLLPSVNSSLMNIGSIFSGSRVSAAAPAYDYGVPKIGFSVEDIEDPKYEDPFINAGSAADTLKSSPETHNRAEKCFGVKISTEDVVTVTPGDKPPTYADLNNPELNCNSRDESWIRIRFFILDSQLVDSYVCYEGVDDQSCANIGMSSSVGSPNSEGSN